MSSEGPPSNAAAFPRTQWSLVLAATQESPTQAAAALEELCHAYWQPLYCYARRCGQSPHDAQDLTQDFFAELLHKRWLESADREKGRLRTFLITAMKHFMAKSWRKHSAQRRGGGQVNSPLDTQFAEHQPNSRLAPEHAYDRQWAMTLLELTLKRLGEEFAAAGRAGDFDGLKPCLMAAHGAIDYGSIAATLGIPSNAARVAVHRLRKRFRELYREEVSKTLERGADLDGEIRYLAGALAREENAIGS